MVNAARITLCLLICSLTLWSQSGSAELTGIVTDQAGDVVAHADISLTDLSTLQTRTTQSSNSGTYRFDDLKVGEYRLAAHAAGFAITRVEHIQLSTGLRRALDVKLNISSAESIEVSAQPAPLEREQSDLQDTIPSQTIVALPLNGRNFISLTTLSPGVSLPPGTQLPRINGGRPRTNEYLYDGVSALQPEPGQVAFFPIPDAIAEFNIQTNSVSAEFGRFNGGVVNLTTRSGTDDLRGTLFEFVRNEALNAKNYFAPPGQHKPEFRRNQFGATLGGPLVVHRTFFFADYQGTLQAVGTTRISTVPTLLQRQGIFSEPIAGRVLPIYDPATTTSTPTGFTRTRFANNTVPSNRIDPIARALLARYPLPTSSGTSNNYTRVVNDQDHQQQFDLRLDQQMTGNDQIFARYSYAHDVDSSATPLPDGSGNITTGVLGPSNTLGQQFVTSYQHVFGPSFLNDVRFGYTRRALTRTGATNSTQLPGLPGNAAFNNALPQILISGVQQLGSASSTFSDFRTDVFQLVDTASREFGAHALKFGIDFRWERLDVVQPPNPTGSFTFSQLFTDLPGVTNTGNAFASFLLGQVANFSVDLQQKVIRPRAHIEEFFAQDDWKISPRLTLNVGLRYTLNFPSTEANDQSAVFDLATQQLRYLGRDGVSRSARELHPLDFAPRIGMSYLLTPKTVLRSGYGLVWIEQTGITTPFTTPFFPFLQTVTQRTLDSINPAFVLSQGPSVSAVALSPDAGLGQGVFAVNRKLGSGYVQQWNLAIERELTRTTTLELAYAGSHIVHVGLPDANLNQLTPAQLAFGPQLLKRVANPYFGQIPRSSNIGDPTIPVAQLLKPFPRFTNVTLYRNNIGDTHYNAAELKLQQRLWHSLHLSAAYTHSKLIDIASSVFDASVLTGPIANFPVADSYNLRRERDSSTGDTPNVFSAGYEYSLPRWSGRGARLLTGWEISGIVNVQSGLPLAITQATNFNAFAGYGVQRPNIIGSVNLPVSQRTPQHFFNTSAFAIAPQFTLGNAPRNPVRGPAYRDWDTALIKHTAVTERLDVEFRAEIFNLTNTPGFAQPNGVLGSASFGTITSTVTDPRVIQFGVKMNF